MSQVSGSKVEWYFCFAGCGGLCWLYAARYSAGVKGSLFGGLDCFASSLLCFLFFGLHKEVCGF